MTSLAPSAADRPRMRGVLHVWAFFGFLAAGGWLVAVNGGAGRIAALVFAASVVGLFGTSALYHRVTWSRDWYARIRALDHAMIFALILGTYTPVFMITLEGRRATLFAATCVGAGLGVLMTLFWRDAPKWVRSGVYLAVGWTGALVVPDLIDAIGWSGLALLAGGGFAYSLGAVIYALKRPNPIPNVFGYHEIFHALVIVACAMHFVLVAFWVLAGQVGLREG